MNAESLTSALTRRRRRFFVYLAAAGPGIIAANAGNDAGGVATYASAGAQFGYSMLFFMVIVTIGYVCIQEMVARLAAHTGKGLAALIREQFSLRLSAFAVLAFALANLGLVVTEFAGIASAFGLWGVSRYVCVPIAAVAIWLLVIVGSYRYAERVFLLLSLAFVTYPIAMILGHPDWKQVALHTVLPHVSLTKAYLLTAVALIGTTITPYIQLYTAGAVVDRGIGPDEYQYERVDAVSGAILSDLVSMCIIIATASVFIGNPMVLNSAAEAARALEPLAGQFASVLFGIGLLGASALAAAVVPLSTSYAVAEAVGVERSVSKSFREGTPLPRTLHRPDHHRGRAGPAARQPLPTDHQHPGAGGGGDPDHAGVRPVAGQPQGSARLGRQRPPGPDRGPHHRDRGRGVRQLPGRGHPGGLARAERRVTGPVPGGDEPTGHDRITAASSGRVDGGPTT